METYPLKIGIFEMSKTTTFSLSTQGLRLANQISRKDFRFVSGSNAFVCDRFQAGFLSPRVTNLILNDPTIEEFSLENSISISSSSSSSESESESKAKIEMIERLLNSESLIVDDKNIEIVYYLSEDLGNIELTEFVLHFFDKAEPLTVSNCITRLKRKQKSGIDICQENDFIATHISEIETEDLRQLDDGLLKDIFGLSSLRIQNEDWLFEKIFNLGPSYLKLLGKVRFEFLSQSSIDFFFEHFCFEDMDSDIWHQIWLRSRHEIVSDKTNIQNQNDRLKDIVIRLPESPWSGLIHYLSEMCGGNVHEKGIVNITCSSREFNQCWEVVNYGWTKYFDTTNEPNSWIQFDFKDRVVSVTHYALKSHSGSQNWFIQWKLQGSVDGNTWSVLDTQNTQDLNGQSKTKIFECHDNSSVLNFYRYIRFTQTGKTSHGQDYLILTNIEFFGSIANAS
jgi:hypothetical protein